MKKILLTLAYSCRSPRGLRGTAGGRIRQTAETRLGSSSKKNFSMETIKSVELDRKSTWDRYVVCFDNGSTIAFDGDKGT